MLFKLFRKYNQNRRTIWTIIAIIAFFIILLQAVFGLIRTNRKREQEKFIDEYYKNQNSISNNDLNENKTNTDYTNQSQLQITNNSSYEDIINYFVKLCNDQKIEEAYNMISEDCKSVLFPTIDYFRNNYYNKIFTQKKSVKIEKSMYKGDIYKVTYNNNILANGGYTEQTTLQDYIYITKEDDEPKVSLNKFIGIKNVNKVSESNNISIRVIQKKEYLEHIEYQIQISNNSNESIYIMPNAEKVYLLDENNVKYTSNIDELQSGVTLIEPNKNKAIGLTFNKIRRFK